MKFIKLATFTCLLGLSFSNSVSAYDEDTHFYGTYAMARYAGIKHEVAAFLAAGAQWMDEEECSLPNPEQQWKYIQVLSGYHKRRLLHFADTERIIELKDMDKNEMASSAFGNNKVNTQTPINHPLASQMTLEGLQEGWLLKVAGGLHTLEDSFAHSGTPAGVGHAPFGHWPDRPFYNQDSLDKYFRVGSPITNPGMCETVLHVLVNIRKLLPPEALDMNLVDRTAGFTKPNATLDAETLARGYTQNKLIRKTVSTDILKSAEYVKKAVSFFLGQGLKLGLIRSQYTSHLTSLFEKTIHFDNTKRAQEKLEEIVLQIIELEQKEKVFYLDADKIFSYMFNNKEQFAGSQNKLQAINKSNSNLREACYTGTQHYNMEYCKWIISTFVNDLLFSYVPTPLTANHYFELEVEGDLRAYEMELRMNNMRKMIQSLYGINIKLEKSDDSRAKKESDPVANIILGKRNVELDTDGTPIVIITFNEQKKTEWCGMINTFLYPSKNKPANFIERQEEERKQMVRKYLGEGKFSKVVQAFENDFVYTYMFPFKIISKASKWWHDIKDTRKQPTAAFLTQDSEKFDELKNTIVFNEANGKNEPVFVPLMTLQDLRGLESRRQKGQDLDETGLFYKTDNN